MISLLRSVTLVFTALSALPVTAFSQQISIPSPPKNSCDFFLADRLWGTQWNAMSLDARCGSKCFAGIWYDGWSDWRILNAHLGIVQPLVENESVQAFSWATLEGQTESWPSVHHSEFHPLTSLGLTISSTRLQSVDSLLFSSACNVNPGIWQWFCTVEAYKGHNSIKVQLGESRLFSGWRAEYSYNAYNHSLFCRIEGPQPSISAGAIFRIKRVDFGVRHVHRPFGNSSEFKLQW